MSKSNVVDVTHPNANMYGCLPCPKCHEHFRYPTQDGVIRCDDCGYTEKAS